MSKQVVSLTMQEAREAGIVVCKHCAWPPNNHFGNGEEGGKCAHDNRCPGYEPKFVMGKSLMMNKDEEYKSLILSNRMIDAIKLHRSHTGLGLKESLHYIEELRATLPVKR